MPLHYVGLILYILLALFIMGRTINSGGGDYDFGTPLLVMIEFLAFLIGLAIFGGIYWW